MPNKREPVENFYDRLLHARRVLRAVESLGVKPAEFERAYLNLPRATRTTNKVKIEEMEAEIATLRKRLERSSGQTRRSASR